MGRRWLLAVTVGSPDCTYHSMGDGLWLTLSAGTAFSDAAGAASANLTPVTGALSGADATAAYATVGGVLSVADVTTLLG